MTVTIKKVDAIKNTIILSMDANDLVLLKNVFFEWLKENDGKAKHYKFYKDIYVAKEICQYGTINGAINKIINLNEEYKHLLDKESEKK